MANIGHRTKVFVWTRYQDDMIYLKVVLVDELVQGKGGELTLNIVGRKSGRVILRKKIKKLKWAASEEIVISCASLPDGCSEIQGEFVDDSGREYVADIIQDSVSGELPSWLGSNEGVETSSIPAPWHPLKVANRGRDTVDVDCNGRTYRFGKTPFIDAIFTEGTEVFSRSVRLILKSGRRTLPLCPGRFKVLTETAEKVVIRHELKGDGLVVCVDVAVEFDGMVRFDWGVMSTRPIQVDSLAVEISLRPATAQYLYHFPGKWGNLDNSGVIRSHHTSLGFCPFVWLGNEKRGLAWFMESQQNWFCPAAKRAIEIVRSKSHVVLRLNLISARVLILPEPRRSAKSIGPAELIAASRRDCHGDRRVVESPLSYTFGLQATPIKTETEDAWDYRTICLQQHTDGMKPRLKMSKALLDKLVDAGVRTVVLFEHWTDIEGHSQTEYGREIQRIVEDCHRHDIRVLLYFGFLLSDAAPEWDAFGARTLVTPKRGYPIFHYWPQIDQSAWTVCLRSSWQDFIVEGVARAMDDWDIDGVYLDGTAYPWGCTNTLHGCGVVSDDGSVSQTYPIFAVRNSMRRIYSIVKSRKRDGQVNVHNSTCMTIPTIGWATSCWNGEQLRDIASGTDVRSLSWLETFRTEFMGHQWGVSAEFLSYGKPHTQKEAWGIALLHDIPGRPGTVNNELSLASRIWKVMDGFDRKNAQWEPYWCNSEFVKESSGSLLISIYFHSENGMLAIISNLCNEDVEAEIEFVKNDYSKALEWSKVKNALTNQQLSSDAGLLSISLGSYGWVLLGVPKSARKSDLS